MAEFPALPLFTDAYFGDTRHLTCLEHGAYLQLLMVAWRSRDCMLPNDDARLAKYVGLTALQWARIAPTIREFFDVENGGLIQRRLKDEHALVRQRRDAQAANGRASALKRKGRHSAKRERSESKASTPTPTPTPTVSPEGDTPHIPFAAPQPEWAHFVEFRKRKGAPLTEHAVKLALAKLERLQTEGHDPREVLNQSIMNGWNGLFPIKDDRNGKRTGSGWDHV